MAIYQMDHLPLILIYILAERFKDIILAAINVRA